MLLSCYGDCKLAGDYQMDQDVGECGSRRCERAKIGWVKRVIGKLIHC